MLFANFLELFLESAPWLLLGLVLAGMLKIFVPMAWMQKQLGGHGFKATVKAAILGAPLPLCSCGVIPAAIALRRAGASKAATTSFLVSTPETGVDSVTVSYVLLGPFMAIARPVAAIVSAIVAGLLVGRDEDDTDEQLKSKANAASASSCCSSKSKSAAVKAPEPVAVDAVSACSSSKSAAVKTPERAKNETASACCSSKSVAVAAPVLPKYDTVAKSSCCSSKSVAVAVPVLPKMESETTSCCSSKAQVDENKPADDTSCCESTQDIASELKHTSVISRMGKGLHYAATDLVKDTTVWLLIGLFFAALVQTYVPGDFLVKWGDGILAMLVMVVVSVPMYICATASTPIAAGLLLAGVSPGAVLVFMLAGPATNIATLGVVSKELGKRALFGYLGGVLGVALLSGILVNYLVDTFGFEVMPQVGEHHELLPDFVVYTSGVILAILMAKVLLDKLPKNWWRRDCCS